MASDLLIKSPKMVDGWILDHVPDMEDHGVLLHPTLPTWAVANKTGLLIASCLDGTRSVEEVAQQVADEFHIDVDGALLEDVSMYISQLERAGLLESSDHQSIIRGDDQPTAPPSLTVYLTEDCNLRCKHCAIVEGKMTQTKLDAGAVKTIIDDHLANHPGSGVTFLGGEPLMHPDCMELLEYAAAKTPRVCVCTNGLLVTDEIARRLAGMKVEVQISLDGADTEGNDAIRGKGTFRKAWTALEQLVAFGMAKRLTVATTLTRSVVNNVRDLVGRLDELGVGAVRFLPLNKRLAARTNWDSIHPTADEVAKAVWWVTFEAEDRPGAVTKVKGGFPGYTPKPDPKNHWCPLGKTFIVDSQGDAYVCPSLKTKDVYAGNALDSGLQNLENGADALKARDWMLGRRDRVEECRKCSWRNFCQGGCLAFMAHLSGSFDRNDEFCELRRNMYRRNALEKAGMKWSPRDILGSRIADEPGSSSNEQQHPDGMPIQENP